LVDRRPGRRAAAILRRSGGRVSSATLNNGMCRWSSGCCAALSLGLRPKRMPPGGTARCLC
jgi:hypothetical protein